MEVDTQSSGNDDCMSASELKEEQEELEVAIADDAETGTSGPTETLEGWKQVHTQLIDAILVAKEAVAAKKLQRRYWMEEICSNLTPETGKLTATSIWKQPVASKDRVKQKKTAVAKKRKRSTEPKAKKTTEKKKKATANKRKSSTRDDEGEAEGEEGENKEDGVKKEKSEEKPPPKKKKKKLTKKESRGGAERNLQDTPDHETPAMFDMKNKGRDGKDKTSAADAETKEEREDMTPTKKKKASTEGATNDSSFPKADLSPMSSAASASSHPPPAILQSHHEYGTMAQQHWPSHPPPPHRAPYMQPGGFGNPHVPYHPHHAAPHPHPHYMPPPGMHDPQYAAAASYPYGGPPAPSHHPSYPTPHNRNAPAYGMEAGVAATVAHSKPTDYAGESNDDDTDDDDDDEEDEDDEDDTDSNNKKADPAGMKKGPQLAIFAGGGANGDSTDDEDDEEGNDDELSMEEEGKP
ncbi:MAG: hypothetical protein SGBAC_008496 [Bacillariaceae sp.]